ncbi:hypothetical protein SLE2022_156440 [Rubroshorea leprosula]
MKMAMSLILMLLFTLLFAGFEADALTYDYSASIECLENPWKPLYDGGIIVNRELNLGLEGWHPIGDAKIEHKQSALGNKFIVARGRNQSFDGASQKIYLKKNMIYAFSAWIQVSQGKAPVTAVFKTTTDVQHAGAVVAESKCWSMLKGGLSVDESGPAELYFESDNISVDIWVDSISLQPFTQKEWSSHQEQSIQKIRNTNMRVQAVDAEGNPLPNATISISQKASGFPFGCAINKNILNNQAYQNWFTSRFKVTTFEDEMKWYSTEPSQGREDYSVADAMLNFAQQHGVAVRGHNVLWEDPQYQAGWIYNLSPSDLYNAAVRRLTSIMTRYKGKLIAWDVVNENLHFSFFESKLGATISAYIYKLALGVDSRTPLFLNEFNTIEDSRDGKSTPVKYLEKLREIKAFRGNGDLNIAIGLESHFGVPNIPYVRASLDTLAAAKVPIWITELDVLSNPNQAQFLEQILREVHSHPAVNGIVIWGAWKPGGCYRMCLTDNNFKNLPTGDVVDKLLREWGINRAFEVSTDSEGFYESSLPHGDYEAKITHPTLFESSPGHTFKVTSTSSSKQQSMPVVLQVPA